MTQQNTLQAQGVCKHYGKLTVLQDLDLTIEPGCIYGLIGRNGAGKTTLLSILTGQNTMDAGTVCYNGEPVWENQNALRNLCFSRELNVTMTNGNTSSLRVKDYLRAGSLFFPYWDSAYADRLVEKFGLDRKKKIFRMSKGQSSMVTIILALASRAPITILDEPVAGLDVVAREQFYRLLVEDYTETNRTFIISTHIIEEAAGVFERVIVLDEGRVVADSPVDAFVNGFRYLSGPEEIIDAALSDYGLAPLQTQLLGRHKMVAVRGDPQMLEQLSGRPGLEVSTMNLQNAFVALCGHGEE